MEKLNLSYRLDKVSFDKLVRTDAIVANIRTLDAKIRFFETACKRDPNNPYVLQHFARMLQREKQLILALSQIDSALRMNDKPRVLHHTRGAVLAELALSAENEDVGRKWLLQSENEFRLCLSLNPRDDYGYHGLASLYLGWAKKVKSGDESSDYLTKCEAAISEGLRSVKERESLWLVSAEVQKWLGNQPLCIERLKKAVSENTTSAIPRYLLGREYRLQGQPEKALNVLEPVIKTRFEEFRSYIEYVKAMLLLNQSYSKCVAVLSLARLDGMTDPSYVGLLGGLLFMDGKVGEADEVFAESVKQGFTYDERYKIQWAPRDPSNNAAPLRLTGRVTTVKPTYVFIQSDKYGDFISRPTRAEAAVLRRGTEVTFQPAFSARGTYADHVQLATVAGASSTA